MAAYIDCPECGCEKMPATCRKCHTCECVERVSNEYDTQIESLRRELAEARAERDEWKEAQERAYQRWNRIESKLRPLAGALRQAIRDESAWGKDPQLYAAERIGNAVLELFPAQPSEEKLPEPPRVNHRVAEHIIRHVTDLRRRNLPTDVVAIPRSLMAALVGDERIDHVEIQGTKVIVADTFILADVPYAFEMIR